MDLPDEPVMIHCDKITGDRLPGGGQLIQQAAGQPAARFPGCGEDPVEAVGLPGDPSRCSEGGQGFDDRRTKAQVFQPDGLDD